MNFIIRVQSVFRPWLTGFSIDCAVVFRRLDLFPKGPENALRLLSILDRVFDDR